MVGQHGHAAVSQVAPRKSANPLCFLMDEDFSIRQALAGELRRRDVDVIEFSSSDRLKETIARQSPDIVFVDLNRATPHKCVRVLLTLKECGYAGAVQLFGQGDAKVLESFNTIGTDCALTMLPPLAKPIEFATVHKIILDRRLVAAAPVPLGAPSLEAALERNMVKFLYQPKLELKGGVIVGAELLVRIAHPERGLLTPDQFLTGNNEDTHIALSRLALIEAVKASAHFLELGIALRPSINISMSPLLRLPIADLVLMHRPERADWPGLILEIPAQQVANKIEALKTRLPRLLQSGLSIAIDNFGLRAFDLNLLNELPLAEIKIDRALVEGCAGNAGNATICKTIIQMAHNFGAKAAAVGISTAEDLHRLSEFGCDLGQGFLFGKPVNRPQMDALISNVKGKRAQPDV
jgi:EAL domain-containing protein (putative c-di-GMP-specific phosphodiesterase class I)